MRTLLLLAAASLPITLRGDAKAELDAILAEYRTALSEFEAQCAALEKEEGAAALAEFRASWNPANHFVTVCAEKADEYAGTKDAVRFLEWIVFHAPAKQGESALPEPARLALATLVGSHPKEAQGELAGLPYAIYEHGKERCLAVAAAVIATSEDRDLAHAARLARAGIHVNALPPGDARLSDADMAEALADARAVVEAGSGALATSAARALFELENLQVGDIAPDIEGRDTDGVAFKLSDYRGKVVMVDFWGDW
jgi:hypothetical protein